MPVYKCIKATLKICLTPGADTPEFLADLADQILDELGAAEVVIELEEEHDSVYSGFQGEGEAIS